MNEENRITLILIDTCAFRDANSDFPGIAKSLLPSFFSTADEKGITLLTHPVLENEIHKHIEDSGIFKDYQSLLTQLRKCTSTLKHYKLDDVLLSSKISELDIQFLPLYHGEGENQRFFCLWSFMWSNPLLCRFRQSWKIPQTQASKGFAAFRLAPSRIPPRHSQSRRATNCATPGYILSA